LVVRKRSWLAAVVLAATIVGSGSTAAFAGEITGNGKPVAAEGRSICKFSGQNDDPTSPVDGGRTQSFGQIVRQVGPLGGIPGTACNPTKSDGEPQ
jgi:hypothetical protein